MNTIYERAVSDMTLEHVNHHERAGVLPIAFSLSHFMRAQDQSVSGPFFGGPTLWDSEGWAAKVGVSVDRLGREETVEQMENLRFADFDAWRAFQSSVNQADRWSARHGHGRIARTSAPAATAA